MELVRHRSDIGVGTLLTVAAGGMLICERLALKPHPLVSQLLILVERRSSAAWPFTRVTSSPLSRLLPHPSLQFSPGLLAFIAPQAHTLLRAQFCSASPAPKLTLNPARCVDLLRSIDHVRLFADLGCFIFFSTLDCIASFLNLFFSFY